MMVNQSTWKKVIYKAVKGFEEQRIRHSSLKQALWKQDYLSLYSLKVLVIIWSKVCLSKVEPANHMRSHDSKLLKTCFTKVLQQQPTGNFDQFLSRSMWVYSRFEKSYKGEQAVSMQKTPNSFFIYSIGIAWIYLAGGVSQILLAHWGDCFLQRSGNQCIYIYIYIYIYTRTHTHTVFYKQTVSLYHKSSVWLDTQDTSSCYQNPPNFMLDLWVGNRSQGWPFQ